MWCSVSATSHETGSPPAPMRARPGGGTAPWGFPSRARVTTLSQPRACCRGGSRVVSVWRLRHVNRAAMSLDAQMSLDARRRTRHGAHVRRSERPAHARALAALVARSLAVGSALGVARAPSRRCDPRHVLRRLRQPRDAAGARPLGRRVVLAARAPAAALARLSDRRSACARPLGRALPPSLAPQWGLRPASRAPAGLWVGGWWEAPSLPSGCGVSWRHSPPGREGLSPCQPKTLLSPATRDVPVLRSNTGRSRGWGERGFPVADLWVRVWHCMPCLLRPLLASLAHPSKTSPLHHHRKPLLTS